MAEFTRRLAATLLGAALASAQNGTNPGASATDDEWSTFVQWVKALQPGSFGNQAEVFAAYKRERVGNGMAAADAAGLDARLQARSKVDPEWTRVNFNRVYSQRGNQRYHEGTPNAFLVETTRGKQPGKALDVGMGEGRNSIYLAQQGWDVTGLELSDVAIGMARERGKKLGARFDIRMEDAYQFDYGRSRWDLVCLMYFVIPDDQPTLYGRIADSLRPDGYVIVEGLGNPAMETLQRAWAKWQPTKLELMRYEYLVGLSDWSSTPGAFGRLLLRKAA